MMVSDAQGHRDQPVYRSEVEEARRSRLAFTPEQLFKEELAEGWNNSGATYTGYASDAGSYLALQQGKMNASS